MTKQMKPIDFIQTEEITLDVGSAIEAFESISMLMNEPVGVVLSKKIAIAGKQITAIVKDFEDYKDKLREEYATKEENKETGQIKYNFGDNEKKVQDELKAYTEAPTTVSASKIKLEEFGEQKLAPKVLASLDWLIIS